MSQPRVPKRRSLVEETVEVMIEGIRGGRWAGVLPGEHALCGELKVSRTTLRKALDHLARQGLLAKGGHGRRHQLLPGSRARRAGAGTGGGVRLVSLLPESEMVGATQTALEHFHSGLEAAGYAYHFDYCPWLRHCRRMDRLKALVDRPDVAGWVLMGTSEKIQRWFAEQNLPVMVLGSRFRGVRLPCVETANAAVGRHAALEFIRRGHRRIALIHATVKLAGDELCGEGLCEGAAQHAEPVEIVDGLYHPSPEGIRRCMAELLAGRRPPTAFFVAQPNFVWPVVGCLQQSGRRIPDHASVISRGDDLFLTTSVPEVARYIHDGRRLGKMAARAMVSLIKGSLDPKVRRTLMPDFVVGETLGPAPPAG